MQKEYLKIEPGKIEGFPEAGSLGPGTQIVVDRESGTIVKIGDPREVNDWIGGLKSKKELGEVPPFKVENLTIEQAVLCPGLVDTHTHPTVFSMMGLVEPSFLFGINEKEKLKQQLKKRHKQKEGIVLGIGWSTTNIPDLSREDLDAVSEDTPVIVMDISFHGGVANTKGLEMLEKLAKKREKDIGRPLKGEMSKTGRVTEEFVVLAWEAAEAAYSVEELAEASVKWIEEQLNHGITDVHDMGVFTLKELASIIKSSEKWEEKHPGMEFPVSEFYIRPEVLADINAKSEKIADIIQRFENLITRNIVGVKIHKDGSIGSYTANLGESFLDKETKGMEYDILEEAKNAFQMAREQGIQKIATHAIGDEAIRKAIEFARCWFKEYKGKTFRIEHFEIAGKPEIIKKAAEVGIWVSSQPVFMTDIYVYRERLGEKRAYLICPHKSIVEAGIPMMFGTDGMPQNMLFALWCAVHHPNEKERLSLEEAFIAAAAMAGEYERSKRGKLTEGAPADFMVIDPQVIDDILRRELSPEEIKEVLGEGGVNDLYRRLHEGVKIVIKSGRMVRL